MGIPTDSPSSLPPPKTWRHRPVFLQDKKASSLSSNDASGVDDQHNNASVEQACPIGLPFAIKSNLFEGQMLFRVKDLDASDNQSADKEYFDGRKRNFQIIVQGRFSKAINVNDVIFGAEYSRPLKIKPPAFMMAPMQALIRRACPGIEIDLLSDHPTMLSTFAGGVQTIRVDEPDDVPDITSVMIEEETTRFGGAFDQGKDVSRAKRKKLFSNPKHAKEYTFDPKFVYTFDHYDDILDLESFQIKMSRLFHYDLDKVVDDPFQSFAKLRRSDNGESEYLWDLELWHEKLVSKSNESMNDDKKKKSSKFRKSAPPLGEPKGKGAAVNDSCQF